MSEGGKYTPEIADKICDEIAVSNRGLAWICKKHGIHPSTWFRWLADKDHQDLRDKYARAREAQADFLAEEILEIADHSDKDTVIIYDKAGNAIPVEDKEWTNRSRLRVDARKWIAGKLKPKKYGDKIDHTTDGEKINQVTVTVVRSGVPLAGDEKEVSA